MVADVQVGRNIGAAPMRNSAQYPKIRRPWRSASRVASSTLFASVWQMLAASKAAAAAKTAGRPPLGGWWNTRLSVAPSAPAPAAALSDMMLDEKRLLGSLRTVRREEVKPSIPATNTAAASPYQLATRRTTASASVKVSRSRVSFDPTGIRRCCGNRPTSTTSGMNAKSPSRSSPTGGTMTASAAAAQRPRPRAVIAP